MKITKDANSVNSNTTPAIVPINDPMMPLSNDEITLFRDTFGLPDISMITKNYNDGMMKYNELIKDIHLTQREDTDKIVTAITSLANAQVDVAKSNTMIVSSINDAVSKINALAELMIKATSSTNVVSPSTAVVSPSATDNPIFYSTMSVADQLRWINKTRGIISSACMNDANNEGNVYKSIYAGMSSDGYDVDALLKEFRKIYPKSSVLDMCSKSDVLRLSFEKHGNKIWYKNVNKKYRKKSSKRSVIKVGYKDSHSCPAEIRTIINGISSTGKCSGRTFSKALNVLEKDYNLNRKRVVRETCKKYKLNSCNIWFAIAQYPELVDALNEIAKARA